MAKQKRARQKFHLAAQKQKNADKPITNSNPLEYNNPLPITLPTENIFAGIDFTVLKKNLNDDTRSVKSYKSAKSELGKTKILPKKEKLKLRREVLLKKIDTVNQMKKELKIREKRKNTAVIGNTNPLHDALPSLDSLLKSRPSSKVNCNTQKPKGKGIQKAKKRKKQLIEGVNIFKQVLNNKNFQQNPFDSITNYVKAVVEQERSKLNK